MNPYGTRRMILLACHALAAAALTWSGVAPVSAQEPIARTEPVLPLENCLIWGALVRGSDQKSDSPAKLPSDVEHRLREAFGLGHFQLLGEHTQPVLAEFASYVVPSEELYMKIDCKGQVEDGLALHLQLWREESVIVKTDVILRDQSPVLIAGPKWGEDQLFFVVELQLKNSEPVAAAAATAAP